MKKKQISEKKLKEIEIIYEMYKRFIHNIAFRYFRDHYLANDMVQECMLRLLEKCEVYTLDDPVKARGLVAKIAVGICLDKVDNIRRELPSEIYEDTLGSVQPVEIDHAEYYLSMINQADAELIRLRVIQGYSFEEIAEHLGVNKATVRKRYQRAKEKLQKEMEDDMKLG